jgi:chromosome partitioning protein
LAAADEVLVPIQCEYYALEGLGALMGTINRVRDRINPGLSLRGVVLTMFDARTTLSMDVSREVRRHLGDRVFDAVVPRSVRLAEAPSYGRPIPMYSPASRGAQAYQQLAAEMMGTATGVGGPTQPAPAWVTGS